MIDFIVQASQVVGYALLLVVLTILWMKVVHRAVPRHFWLLLALAWTMDLFGNIAWIVHDLVTGSPLDSLSVVDLFYILRYMLIGLSLWRYPHSLSRRDGIWVGAMMLVVNLIVWVVYFRPIMALQNGSWTDFLGYALYPVLDVALISLAWLRYRAERRSSWAGVTLLLFCAVASYGLANTLNLSEYAFSLVAEGIFPGLFWILTDILVLTMILGMKKNVVALDSNQ